MKTFIAIDPGAKGGVAVFYENGLSVYPMPETPGAVLELIGDAKSFAVVEGGSLSCVLEKVGGFAGKGQPGSAMFNFGKNYGFLLGVLQALEIPVTLVTPQVWQKAFSLGTASACASKTIWKNKLKGEAERRFPSARVTLATADALLIGEWFRLSRK